MIIILFLIISINAALTLYLVYTVVYNLYKDKKAKSLKDGLEGKKLISTTGKISLLKCA